MRKISKRMIAEAIKSPRGEVWSRSIRAGQSTRFYRYNPDKGVVEVGTVSLGYDSTYHLNALYRVEAEIPIKEVI